MRSINVGQRLLTYFIRVTLRRRNFASLPKQDAHDVTYIRNIGIMAHIDAGKTTTTERMLYYSGFSRHIGEVHHGDTIMDYMEQERERGITITSAAITFYWKKHKINLIDTPGHVDFTIEVDRALRVLDGAITVLDASAGVEAQTLTVWRQANKYKVPRLIYLNKMDKLGANLKRCLKSIREKLHVDPYVISIPIGTEKSFKGVVDIVTMEKIIWDQNSRDGRKFSVVPLDETSDKDLFEEAINYRSQLIGKLADVDDRIAEHVLNDTRFEDIPEDDIKLALKHVALRENGVILLCGSSLRNKGVQPLMDAVNYYLPNPSDVKHEFAKYYGNNLCALAFKIVHDKDRGALTFLRLYSGLLKAGTNIYNVSRDFPEKVTRVLQVSADEFTDMKSVTSGNIVCVAGLYQTISGDTLTNTRKSAISAKEAHMTAKGSKPEPDDENLDDAPILAGLDVPAPVFFCSIEPPSMSQQKNLDIALSNLQREDPSLNVELNPDTAQTVISGMGELHLDIIKSRILKEYKIDADMGPLQIAYRETITKSAELDHSFKSFASGRETNIEITMSIHPDDTTRHFTEVKLAYSKDDESLHHLTRPHLKAINRGVEAAVSLGPILRFPVIHADIHLHSFRAHPATSIPLVSAAASQCISRLLDAASSILLEPMMKLEIVTEEARFSGILSDLSHRRSNIEQILDVQGLRMVHAMTPLAELVGYSTYLRTATSGTATFSMHLSHYQPMNSSDQNKAIEKVTGFAPQPGTEFRT